jgi:zinc transport system substrate-binding protein
LLFSIVSLPSIAQSASKRDKPTVAATNYPLKYFAERIVGDNVRVIFPIPPDIDPAFWIPEPEGVLGFQASDLILLNGAHYSKWLDKVSLPRRKVVNTSHTFRDKFITIQEFTTHRHGPQGEHAHAGVAFTTWLDFQQAIQQAEVILNAVIKLVPQFEKQFQTNFLSLKKDLEVLDRQLESIASTQSAKPFAASHPVYHYLARRYGLNIRSVLWEPSEIPTTTQLEELEKVLKNHPAKWMIWEGEPHPRSVALLQTLGVNSVVFDPAGNEPVKGDFLSVMQQNVENLKLAFN